MTENVYLSFEILGKEDTFVGPKRVFKNKEVNSFFLKPSSKKVKIYQFYKYIRFKETF